MRRKPEPITLYQRHEAELRLLLNLCASQVEHQPADLAALLVRPSWRTPSHLADHLLTLRYMDARYPSTPTLH